jgi:hypothetical protein
MYNSRTGEQIPTSIFIGPTTYQRLKHMTYDKIHCLTADHEVLTDRGWVPIADVDAADLVATLCAGALVYAHPIKTLHFHDYHGKMYKIKNENIDLKVTVNHRMWVARINEETQGWGDYGFTEAEDLVGTPVLYQNTANWDHEPYQFVLPGVDNIPAKTVDMEAWLNVFGNWISNGWAYKGTGDQDTVTFQLSKKYVYYGLWSYMSELGLDYCKEKETAGHTKVRIHNKQLQSYLKDMSVHVSERYLPDWVWLLSKNQAQSLLYSMSALYKNGNLALHTSSTRLADDFMRLCLHAGWSTQKKLHTSKYQLPIWKMYVITRTGRVFNLDRKNPVANMPNNKNETEKVFAYNGSVYCLQVPSEVFYVRRNGKACWTGNSRASNGPVVMLTRQPAEGRARDGGLRLGEMEIECNWAHGIVHFLKERFMECSDNYRVYICKKCGMIANVNPDKNIYCCKSCKNSTHFSQIRIPYACKLLFQEIQTMSIGAKFIT